MDSQRFLYNLNNAFEAFLVNRVRSFLTALGIIFGVAAVISMLAIGNGARQEILDQIKMVGVNNIIIMPKDETHTQEETTVAATNTAQSATPNKTASTEKDKGGATFSPGLTLNDAESIKSVIPSVLRVSPEISYNVDFVQNGLKGDGKITGVTNEYFKAFNIAVSKGGMFNNIEIEKGSPVCIIGSAIESRFFNTGNAIGSFIRCGGVWFRIIGVIKQQTVNSTQKSKLGITDTEKTIFVPIKAVLLRFLDRSFIDVGSVRGGGGRGFRATGSRAAQLILNMNFKPSSGGDNSIDQLDKIVVQVKESTQLVATNAILTKMLKRRHGNNDDFEIKVPELLLKQEQRTKDIFNIVLGAIAGISLIVGGIGIMNIMLASVMERTKEIGIRMGIGARRTDIVMQFISEAVIISVIGGLIGILLGVLIAKTITQFTGIQTIVSFSSVFISFGVSATIGIVFGYMPAKRAAMQDPVFSLRYE